MMNSKQKNRLFSKLCTSKTNLLKSTVAALLAVTVVQAANNVTDKVTSLPDCAPLPTNWYSGFMDVTASKSLHYVFIESQD